jgi:flagellar hook-associated protein 2
MPGSDVSVIDVSQYVEWELAKRELPLKRLMKSEKDEEIQLSRYGSLQSLFTNFQTAMTTLSNTYNAVSYQATSSNTSAITAQVTSNIAAPLTHTINVQNLAQAESQISQGFSSQTPGLSGSITIAVGSLSAAVTISDTDSIQNIRDNINSVLQAANINATASIFATNPNGTPQYQLIISSNQTGAANAVTVTDSGNLLGFTEQFQAKDATFTVDNQTVTSATNVVTSVLDGVTLNLLSASPTAGNMTVTISPVDAGTINTNVTTAIQGILDSYNEIISFIDKCQINPGTKNETFHLLKMSMQGAMTQALGTGPYQSLVDIGIFTSESVKQTATMTILDKNGKEVQKEVSYYSTGQLTLNKDPTLPMLSTALQNNAAAVQSFLTNSTNGLFTTIANTLFDPNLGTISQSMSSNMDAIKFRETTLKQNIADEEVALDKAKDFYTDKYAKLNVMLQKLQATSDRIYKQIEQTQVSRRD